MIKLRVTIQDRFLMSPRGVRRLGQGLRANRIVPVDLNGNPLIITKEVQDWLSTYVGVSKMAQSIWDRYFYPGDHVPSYEECKAASKQDARIPMVERRWRSKWKNEASAKVERYVDFDEDLEEIAMEFMMRFGSAIERVRLKVL